MTVVLPSLLAEATVLWITYKEYRPELILIRSGKIEMVPEPSTLRHCLLTAIRTGYLARLTGIETNAGKPHYYQKYSKSEWHPPDSLHEPGRTAEMPH